MNSSTYSEVIASLSADEASLFPESRFQHLAETGSTNDDLLQLIKDEKAEPFQTIVADYQSVGRGRRGDKWESAAASNLLFSIALPLEIPPAQWAKIPHLAGYLVGNAIESIVGNIKVQSKWPNDILINNRKICGILVETTPKPSPWAVAGIGLNLNMRQTDFPAELQTTATSLYEVMECESSRWFILGEIISGFIRAYPDLLNDFDTILNWAGQRDFLLGKELQLKTPNGEVKGTGAGLGASGELLVKTSGNTIIPVMSAEQLCYC
ncbi:biotin--[acetyl-CoA-carboxylase] ligase [Verrucomicrobiales bacterium BCK34]|nr:biotin--[acetyl-CoA-carboxylase] ligase [Verrucomicrobiales bacterium BCK34]